jgi:hypothetical protein
MSLFKTHAVVGLAAGSACGAVGYLCGLPIEDSLISTGLFALASVAPDIDAKSIPLHELASFSGACVGIAAALYAQTFKYPLENLLMIGAVVYIAIRFCVIGAFIHFAIHRGIFHSILMALLLSEIGYILCTGNCLYKSMAIFGGYITHLVIDEICGINKQSFGTALKLWGNNWIVNVSTAMVTIVLGIFVWLKI